MADETLGQNYRNRGFGHAYELAYQDGPAFRYASDITYLILHAWFSDEGRFEKIEPGTPYFVYRALGKASLVERRYIDTTLEPPDIKAARSPSVGVERYAITPVTIVTPEEKKQIVQDVLGRDYLLSAGAAEFQCVFFLVRSAELEKLGRPWVPLTVTSRLGDPARLVTLTDVKKKPPLTDLDVSIQRTTSNGLTGASSKASERGGRRGG